MFFSLVYYPGALVWISAWALTKCIKIQVGTMWLESWFFFGKMYRLRTYYQCMYGYILLLTCLNRSLDMPLPSSYLPSVFKLFSSSRTRWLGNFNPTWSKAVFKLLVSMKPLSVICKISQKNNMINSYEDAIL